MPPQHIVVLRRWQVGLAFVAVTIAFVVQGVILGWQGSDLRTQQAAIQESRLISCKQTYEGVREIFHPFFQQPAKRTPKQRRDIHKFNRRVNRLKARCDMQVSTKGTP